MTRFLASALAVILVVIPPAAFTSSVPLVRRDTPSPGPLRALRLDKRMARPPTIPQSTHRSPP
ncbi:MAG: hypothetical protein U0794_11145 [Isosphaeraceae bacterium]